MHSSLNLLPKEKIEILHHIYLLYFFKIVAELILLYSSFVAVFLIWTSLILEDNLKQFQTKTTLLEIEGKDISEQLTKINDTLKRAGMVSSAYVDFTQKITNLSLLPMSGITLSGLDLEKATAKITLQGRADNRQNLLNYKKSLEESGLVNNLEIPVSVLTAKENIDFEIKGQIDLK